MYYAENNTEDKFKVSCKGIQKLKDNNIRYSIFENVLHGATNSVLNKSFHYVDEVMKSYKQTRGLK